MVYLSTSEEWQKQSALLLQARPTTTRITTKYKIPNLNSPKYQRVAQRKMDAGGDGEGKGDASASKIPKAALVLKTYDHESGVVLKFRTDRAADIGRLIAGLGRLGRHMAALPQKADVTEAATEMPIITEQTTTTTAAVAAALATEAETVVSESKAQSGGDRKKKRGKK